MKPITRLALLLALSFPALQLPAAAAEIACPNLADVVQVGQCPTEDELRFTYNGYCSDNARIYGKGAELCTDYQLYRREKNTALWETPDGRFHAYVSCDLKPDDVKKTVAQAMKVSTARKITQLACTYGNGIHFAYHSRETCRVTNATCQDDSAACKADCE